MTTGQKQPPKSRNLATTLSWAFWLVSIVVLLISGSLQVAANIQVQQQAITSTQKVIAQDAASRVSSYVEDKFSTMRTAIEMTNLVQTTPQELQYRLQTLLGIQPAFRQLLILNAQDQELASVSRLSQAAATPILPRLSGQPLSQIRQGQDYVGAVYVDETTSEPLLLLAIPVTDTFGDFQGTLAAETNLKFMWDLVDRLAVGKSGEAFVVDKQGYLLAYTDTARVLRHENLSGLAEVDEFMTSPAATDVSPAQLVTGIRGNLVVVSHAALGTPDWAVMVELPWEEAYQGVIQNIIASVLILLLMSTAAGLLGVFIARQLASKLTNLTATATRISAGELTLQAELAGPTEVISLAAAFNAMTLQLRSLIDGLEQRVAERTRRAEAARQEAEEARRDLEVQMWQTTGRVQLSEAIRGEQNAASLAANALRTLCSYLNLPTGVFYLFDGEALHLTGGYAVDDQAPALFHLGEGVVGQAAVDKRTILVDPVPASALRIRSALGQTTPCQVLVEPVLDGDRLVGVLELAGLQPFTAQARELLGQVQGTLATAFETAQAREHVNELLMRTQQQAEELQAQEEELRAANEELQAQEEELRAANEELQAQAESMHASRLN